ncbi:MAG: STAS/SEC14 domain-containing protein [Gammaproteobacteria bacterium]|nr:STAS/SEC14 domain-containing protein [Gammaproteobacteria bacterium]MCB1798223.1 STAS/SEC14 domain-containing protein [Gammaproteobacteria bacterium]
MIEAKLDADVGVLHVRPVAALAQTDFRELAALADPFIEERGSLPGLLLEIGRFPGWEDIAAFVEHFRFVRDHHKHIARVAVVTDQALGELAEKVASHFVAAQVRHYASGQLAQARAWAAGADDNATHEM